MLVTSAGRSIVQSKSSEGAEWSVDLHNRLVRHQSGAEVVFYRYVNQFEWVQTDDAVCRNPLLYPGSINELVRCAKEQALAAGMNTGSGYRFPYQKRFLCLIRRLDHDFAAPTKERCRHNQNPVFFA